MLAAPPDAVEHRGRLRLVGERPADEDQQHEVGGPDTGRREVAQLLADLAVGPALRHELEGRSFKDMAAESGVAVNTLLARKRYAVLALRARLQAVYDEFET